MAIRIVTDSTADLSRDIVEELGITVVPLNVHFGEELFLDWVELTPEKFFNKLEDSDLIPRTSQPSPGDFEKTYKEVAAPEDTIISIHISQQLSGTFQSASMAKDMLSDRDIEVIDTKAASMALGIIVKEAAKAVKEGKSKDEVLDIVTFYLNEIKLLFLVDTLEFLQKNGRIGKASAFLGGLLSVKPLLSLKDGSIIPVEKARGTNKAKMRMIELMKEMVPPDRPVIAAILHGNALTEAEKLAEKIKEEYNVEDLIVTSIGAVIGCHTGPGVLGLILAPVKK